MAAKTNTVLSFAGPFAAFGMPLVDACVKCGTDYCDITGGGPVVHRSLSKT